MSNRVIVSLIVLFVAFFTVLGSMFIVDEREQVLVIRFGNPQTTIAEPGIYFKVPFADNLIRLEKRTLGLDLPPQEVFDKDRKRILVDSFARYRIVDPLKTYQAVRNERGAQLRLQEIMNAAVQKVLPRQLMSTIVSGARADLMLEISAATNERASDLGIEVIDVRLKRVDLPAQNSQAIFQRMRSEREKEARETRALGQESATEIRANADRQVVETISEAEKQSSIIRGQADARATEVFAAAYGQDEKFFEFYRTMQAYRKALGVGDTRLILSADGDFLKLLTNKPE